MTTITVTFDPPLPSDSPATFNSKAFDTLGDLNTWSGQANTVAGEVNTNAANAATSAGTASTHATTATTKAGEANASAVAAAASASSASTSAGTATTKASEADASAIAAAASAASIAPGSLLTAANPSYTGTLTGGTGVVNIGSGQFTKDGNGIVGFGTASPGTWSIAGGRAVFGAAGSNIWGAANDLILSTNADYNSSWKYVATGGAAYYEQYGGTHNWYGAASGSAGAVISGFSAAKMTLDTAGNFGLGVTPSAWGSVSKAIQMSGGLSLFSNTSGTGGVGHNVYSNPGTGDYYIANGFASRYYQLNGAHIWATAPSGTAGDPISFTQAMTLDASGNLLVNATTSSGYNFKVEGSYPILAKMTGGTSSYCGFWNTATSGDNMFMYLNTEMGGTTRGSIDYNRAGGVVRYNTSSDATLKNLIGDADPAKSLAILKNTRLREYSWKDDPANKPQIGVIAQEVHQVFKGAVSVGGEYEEDVPAVTEQRLISEAVPAVLDGEVIVTPAVDAVYETVEITPATKVTKYRPWAVDKTAWTFHLVAGYQHQQAQIEAQQAQIDAQNTAMQLLASRLAALEAAT